MDKEQALSIARQYVELVGKSFGVKKAFLFGSYAKGNYHDESDIDIALVIDEVADIFDTQVAMIKLRRGISIMIEPHPFVEEDFNVNSPVAYEVMKYGIEIGNLEVATTH